MRYTLHWTAEAKKTFDQNLEYLAREWSNEVINIFLDRIELVFEQLVQNPEIYPI